MRREVLRGLPFFALVRPRRCRRPQVSWFSLGCCSSSPHSSHPTPAARGRRGCVGRRGGCTLPMSHSDWSIPICGSRIGDPAYTRWGREKGTDLFLRPSGASSAPVLHANAQFSRNLVCKTPCAGQHAATQQAAAPGGSAWRANGGSRRERRHSPARGPGWSPPR